MEMQKTSAAFKSLLSDKRIGIIYGVLKRLNVHPWQNDYDDLFQEGCLAYVDAYLAFPGDRDNFPAYAFQRIYWRLLDLLRRQSYRTMLSEFSLDQDDSNEQAQLPALAPTGIESALNSTYFTQLAQHCSLNQRRYLHASLVLRLSDHQIAEYFGVSPSAVYQWKRGIIEKARRLDYN